MVTARRIVRWDFGRDHHPVYRRLAQVFTMTAWPFAAFIQLWQMRRFWGPEQMPIRRAPGAIWAAIRHNILPGEYYAYALWKPTRKVNIDNYLYSHEAPRIFKLLNRRSQIDPIDDKLAFYEMCKMHALPSPEILAAFAPSGTLLEFQSGQLPEYDLFVKPRFGLAGYGAERFHWRGDIYENECGSRIRREELAAHVANRARMENRTFLVQPKLSNHPDLHLDPNAALATVRLVTGYSSEDVVAIFGFIYFPRSGRITAQHGRAALIDIVHGHVIPPPPKETSHAKMHGQEAEGVRIEQYLPDWQAALQHIKAAHRLCPNFAFVGWDMAFTGDGPMLLEGNANWSADEYQSITGQPLGHTKFAELLAGRLG